MGLLAKRLLSLLILIPKLVSSAIKFWEYFTLQKKDSNALTATMMKIRHHLKLTTKMMKTTAIKYTFLIFNLVPFI